MTAIPEIPHGAIENGRAFLQRLADHYDFTCEAGSLANCTDYHEAVRCFEFIAQWASELTAALPFLTGVKVKALDWREYEDEQGTPDRWDAVMVTGDYYFIGLRSDGYTVSFDYSDIATCNNIEAAKSAAQADYEARILSAIEVPSPRAQELEEAAKIAEDYVQYDVANAIRLLSSQPVADGWLPIETAPKDGTEVDLFARPYNGKSRRIVDCWWTEKTCWRNQHGALDRNYRFTHWRPLPASPGASE